MEVKNLKSFTINPLNNEIAGEVLKDAIKQLNMPYWVSAGTALGFYRDKDFIEGDTDIDIEMAYYEGIDKDILERLNFDLIRTCYHEGKVQQMAFISKGTIFDIYFYEKVGDEYININEMGEMRFPTRYFDELEHIETKYGTLPFPSPIEDYLKYRYGDWQTPSNKKGLYDNNF